MTTSETLEAAADYIEKHGWTQGGNGIADNGACCASRAICAVTMNDGPTINAHHALLRHIGGVYVPWWNDAPERTAAEVIAALRGAAQAERSRQ